MTQADELLTRRMEFAADGDWSVRLADAPGRWGVALLEDESARPVQLVTLKNLRDGLIGRLGEGGPTGRRVNWRQVVRAVRWAEVDSDFEADWIYLQIAKIHFPQVYQEMVARSRPWFIHVDPQADFPRFVKTIDLHTSPGLLLGPLADKHAAARLIELIEDAFDLCRYDHILAQAPHGKACAYKDMGKCPAPCDGSISIAQYRRMIDLAVAGLRETPRLIEEHTRRMEQASAELRFETAAKIRAYTELLGQLRQGAFSQVRPIDEFSFITVQPGPGVRKAKIFLVMPSGIAPVACAIGKSPQPAELLPCIWRLAEDAAKAAPDDIAAIGLASRHLLAPKSAPGAFVALANLNEQTLADALRQGMRKPRKAPAVPTVADRTGMMPGQAQPP